jgi:hypothetical protein
MKPELPIYILIGMLVAAVSTLTGLGIAVPTELWVLLVGLVGGGLGITVPGYVATSPAVSAPVVEKATPVVASPPVIPAAAPPVPADPFTAAAPQVTQ